MAPTTVISSSIPFPLYTWVEPIVFNAFQPKKKEFSAFEPTFLVPFIKLDGLGSPLGKWFPSCFYYLFLFNVSTI